MAEMMGAEIRAGAKDNTQLQDMRGEVIAEVQATFGGLDILVNNAGTWRRTPVDSSWEQAVADWDFIMDTNLKGLLMLSRASVPLLRARGGGDIINISTYYVLPAKSEGTNQPDTDLPVIGQALGQACRLTRLAQRRQQDRDEQRDDADDDEQFDERKGTTHD